VTLIHRPGQLPSKIAGYDNASVLNSEVPAYGHYLRREGYETAMAGKMHFIGRPLAVLPRISGPLGGSEFFGGVGCVFVFGEKGGKRWGEGEKGEGSERGEPSHL
jgi:arylsulfatase A-like enzyme